MDTRRIYDNPPKAGDREELLADSDGDSSFQDSENDWPSAGFKGRGQQGRRTVMSALKDYWWLYTTGLLILIVILQLGIWYEVRVRSPNSSRQVGGDHEAKGPICLSSLTLPWMWQRSN
jgi:hypothetical protein